MISPSLCRGTPPHGVRRGLVLTLGKPTEIRLRRSEGQPPDAPDLQSESLVLRSEYRAVHTVTVSDIDPAEREALLPLAVGGLALRHGGHPA